MIPHTHTTYSHTHTPMHSELHTLICHTFILTPPFIYTHIHSYSHVFILTYTHTCTSMYSYSHTLIPHVFILTYPHNPMYSYSHTLIPPCIFNQEEPSQSKKGRGKKEKREEEDMEEEVDKNEERDDDLNEPTAEIPVSLTSAVWGW